MLNEMMKIAIEVAQKSTSDIPCGALIVRGDEIIAKCSNEREKQNRIIAHAEILAIDFANKKLNSKYLTDCDMYVTLEPCPMCAWAIINSRIKNLYFGAHDIKYGAFGGAINLKNLSNSKINVYSGIMEDECQNILNNYFRGLRK
ncbi:nucleoside deaminase [bacterium]|nr:nucleoside deaminase [bacterium]